MPRGTRYGAVQRSAQGALIAMQNVLRNGFEVYPVTLLSRVSICGLCPKNSMTRFDGGRHGGYS